MSRTFAAVAVGALFLSAPTAAFAVNVSSDDGSGYQTVSRWYPCGAAVTGKLKSTSGVRVYYGGGQAFNNTTDTNTGRYASDVTSTSLQVRGGQIGPTSRCTYASSFTGVKIHICRNRDNLPDGCGDWARIDD